MQTSLISSTSLCMIQALLYSFSSTFITVFGTGLFFSLPALFQIVFYEGRCFTGRKLECFGDCDNFQDRGFLNRVNSIRVESGAWILYDHPDFKGQQYIVERGEYPQFQRWNSHNDHMSSCKSIRMVRTKQGQQSLKPFNTVLIYFSCRSFVTKCRQGKSLHLNGNIFSLQHGEHYRIELFDGCNYSGHCMEMCDDCPFLQSSTYGKTCVNSVRVFGDGA